MEYSDYHHEDREVQSMLEYMSQHEEDNGNVGDNKFEEGEDNEYSDSLDEVAEFKFKQYMNSEDGKRMLMFEIESLRIVQDTERKNRVDGDVSNDAILHERRSFENATAANTLKSSSLNLINQISSQIGSSILRLYPGISREFIFSIFTFSHCVRFGYLRDMYGVFLFSMLR